MNVYIVTEPYTEIEAFYDRPEKIVAIVKDEDFYNYAQHTMKMLRTRLEASLLAPHKVLQAIEPLEMEGDVGGKRVGTFGWRMIVTYDDENKPTELRSVQQYTIREVWNWKIECYK